MPTMGLNNPDFAYEMVVLPICPKSAEQEKNIMIFILCNFFKASATPQNEFWLQITQQFMKSGL